MILAASFLVAVTLLASAAPEPPPVAERFAEDAHPGQVLLIVDSVTGETVRTENSAAAETMAFPAGETVRLLFGLAGLEDRTLSPETTVDCDSTCWADGAHGRNNLVTALAYSCGTYFRRLLPEVGGAAIRRAAERAGFGHDLPTARAIDEASGFPGPGWRCTAREWVDFWRRFPKGQIARRGATTATLLAAAATTVSSPRATARSLSDPTRLVRAVVGESPEGAWVVGTRAVAGRPPWAFALFVRGASAPLAVARADHLLVETIRTWEHSSSTRNKMPPPPLDLRER